MLQFDEALAALSAEEFAERMLRGIGAEIVAAGETFRFGRGREGDLDLLDAARLRRAAGARSSRTSPRAGCGSSSMPARPSARRALLGRPPEVEGIVVRGDGRGRELGFPTANLDVPAGLLVPPDGVYAGWARDRRAAISIGTNPHFDGVERRVEAHLLDFDGDLYGQRLVVEIWSSIREQRRFDSLEELVAAIERRRRADARRRAARLTETVLRTRAGESGPADACDARRAGKSSRWLMSSPPANP